MERDKVEDCSESFPIFPALSCLELLSWRRIWLKAMRIEVENFWHHDRKTWLVGSRRLAAMDKKC